MISGPVDPSLIGRKFGRLTVTAIGDLRGKNRYLWCRCACGVEKQVLRQDLEWGDTRSCGCMRREKAQTTELEKALSKKWRQYTSCAKVDKRAFKLSRKRFYAIVSQACYYCGIDGSPLNGIDRVDNLRGYTRTNCVPCCTTCNRAKLQMTQREFLHWVQRVYKHSVQIRGEGCIGYEY